MKRLKAFVLTFLFLLLVWLALSWPFSVQELIVGSIFALIVALLPLRWTAAFEAVRVGPRALLGMGRYLISFLVELFKSNMDVAFRVLNPRLPIRPGIVRVRTRLTSPLSRLLLANSITLTPGTITVDTAGEDFYIHWISVRPGDEDAATEAIVSKFERNLEVFLD